MRTWIALPLVLTAAILLNHRPASATTIVLTESSGTCDHIVGCTIDLPFSPVTGQVLLLDPDFFNLPLDVITFDSTTNTAVFASDNIDGFDDPADTFGPPSPLTNQISLTEPSVESGPETLLYDPLPGQPATAWMTVGRLSATASPAILGRRPSLRRCCCSAPGSFL